MKTGFAGEVGGMGELACPCAPLPEKHGQAAAWYVFSADNEGGMGKREARLARAGPSARRPCKTLREQRNGACPCGATDNTSSLSTGKGRPQTSSGVGMGVRRRPLPMPPALNTYSGGARPTFYSSTSTPTPRARPGMINPRSSRRSDTTIQMRTGTM